MTLPYSERYNKYDPVVETTDFNVTFPIFHTSDLEVIVGGVEETGYSVTATFEDGRSDDAVVVLNSPVIGKTVEIFGARKPRRENQYLAQSPDLAANLQRDVEEVTAVQQEQARDIQNAQDAKESADNAAASAAQAAAAAASAGSRLYSNMAEAQSVDLSALNVGTVMGVGAVSAERVSDAATEYDFTSVDGAKWKFINSLVRASDFGVVGGSVSAANMDAIAEWLSCGADILVLDVDASVDRSFSLGLTTGALLGSSGGALRQTANETVTIHAQGNGVETLYVDGLRLYGKGVTDTASTANADFFRSTVANPARAIGLLVEDYDTFDVERSLFYGHKNCGVMGNFMRKRLRFANSIAIGTHTLSVEDTDIPYGNTNFQQFGFRAGAHPDNTAGPSGNQVGYENWRARSDDPNDDEATGVGHLGGVVIYENLQVGSGCIGVYTAPGYQGVTHKNVNLLRSHTMSQHVFYHNAGDVFTLVDGAYGIKPHGTIGKVAYPAEARREPAKNVTIRNVRGETLDGSPLVSLEGNDKGWAGYEGTTYADTASGVAATVNGQRFNVAGTVYRNNVGVAEDLGAVVDWANGPSRMDAVNVSVSEVFGVGEQSWLVSMRNCRDFRVSRLSCEGGVGTRAMFESLYSSGVVEDLDARTVGARAALVTLPMIGDFEFRNARIGKVKAQVSAIPGMTFSAGSEAAPIAPEDWWTIGNIGQVGSAIYRCTATGITGSVITLDTSAGAQVSGTASFEYLGDETSLDRGKIELFDIVIDECPGTDYVIDANLGDQYRVSYERLSLPEDKDVRIAGKLGREGNNRMGQNDGALTIENFLSVADGFLMSTIPPSDGSAPAWAQAKVWRRGLDRLHHPNPTAGGIAGFVCVGSGAPGTWSQLTVGPVGASWPEFVAGAVVSDGTSGSFAATEYAGTATRTGTGTYRLTFDTPQADTGYLVDPFVGENNRQVGEVVKDVAYVEWVTEVSGSGANDDQPSQIMIWRLPT